MVYLVPEEYRSQTQKTKNLEKAKNLMKQNQSIIVTICGTPGNTQKSFKKWKKNQSHYKILSSTNMLLFETILTKFEIKF